MSYYVQNLAKSARLVYKRLSILYDKYERDTEQQSREKLKSQIATKINKKESNQKYIKGTVQIDKQTDVFNDVSSLDSKTIEIDGDDPDCDFRGDNG